MVDTDQGKQVQEGPADFERQKWLAEEAHRARELEFQQAAQVRADRELAFKIAEGQRSKWSSPLVLAIIGAALATLGNGAISWLSGQSRRQLQRENNDAQVSLEITKAESDRILEAIKTNNNPDAAAVNLQFLLDSGLIGNANTKQLLGDFLKNRITGQGPSLPAAASSVNTPAGRPAWISDLLKRGLTLGVDASQFNGAVDFAGLRAQGVEFAYLRASQGKRADRMLKEHAATAFQGGLQVGLYHVFDPALDSASQFVNFSSLLDGTRWTLPPAIDIVDYGRGSDIDPAAYSAQIESFAQLVLAKYKVMPVLYFGHLRRDLDERLNKFPIWIAQYQAGAAPRMPKGWSDYMFWQFSDGAINNDPSIARIDLNFFQGTPDELEALARKRQ